MSRISINFDTDNAPFEDNFDEVKTVLNAIANKIDHTQTDQHLILDSYGHKIGICVVTSDCCKSLEEEK